MWESLQQEGSGGRKYSPCEALLTPAIPRHSNYSFYICFSQREQGGKRKSRLLQECQQPKILSVKSCDTSVDSESGFDEIATAKEKKTSGREHSRAWQCRGCVARGPVRPVRGLVQGPKPCSCLCSQCIHALWPGCKGISATRPPRGSALLPSWGPFRVRWL